MNQRWQTAGHCRGPQVFWSGDWSSADGKQNVYYCTGAGYQYR